MVTTFTCVTTVFKDYGTGKWAGIRQRLDYNFSVACFLLKWTLSLHSLKQRK